MVSWDCKYLSTTATFLIGDETFSCKGHSLIDPGYTEVMHWQALSKNESLPQLEEGEQVAVQEGSPDFWKVPEGLRGNVNQCRKLEDLETSSECSVSDSIKVDFDCIKPSSKGKKFDHKNVEYLGTPGKILMEKGIGYKNKCQQVRKSEDERWNEIPYLKEKIEKLPKELKRVIQNKPEIDSLIVMGNETRKKYEEALELQEKTCSRAASSVTETNIQSTDYDDEAHTTEDFASISSSNDDEEIILDRPLVYDCLKINGEIMQSRKEYKKKNVENDQMFDGVMKKIEFNFKADLNEKVKRSLVLENISSYDVRYAWLGYESTHLKKQCSWMNQSSGNDWYSGANKIKSLIKSIRPDIYSSQKFFFNKLEGFVKPGEVVDIKIFFHSKEEGLFKQEWLLYTIPPLRGSNNNGEIEVSLIGMVPLTVPNKTPHPIEEQFELKEKQIMARGLANKVIEKSTRTVEHGFDGSLLLAVGTDIKDLLGEVQVFHWTNHPKYHYHPSIVANLKALHCKIAMVYGKGTQWNLSIEKLRQMIISLKNDEAKSSFLEIFCNNVEVLLEPYAKDAEVAKKYFLVYGLLCRLADTIEREAESIQISLGVQKSIDPNTRAHQMKQKSRTGRSSSSVGVVDLEGPESAAECSSNATDSLQKSYLQLLYIKVYSLLLRTSEDICICIESTRNKYLVEKGK